MKALKASNRFSIFVYHLFLSFLMFNIGRFVFYIYNLKYFESLSSSELLTAWLGGWRFDLSAGAYINSLYALLFWLLPVAGQNFMDKVWVKRLLKWSYILPNAIAIVLNIGDVAYFPFVYKRLTGTVFKEFGNENIFTLMTRLAWGYIGLVFIIVALIVFLWHAYNYVRYRSSFFRPFLWRISSTFICLLLTAFFFVGAIRGGWAHSIRPITLSNAHAYVRDVSYRAIVLNTPFCLIRTIDKRVISQKEYLPPNEALSLFSGSYRARPLSEQDSLFGRYKDYNVMILIVESFAKEHIGALQEDGKGFTPFIDSLIRSDHVASFKYAFANGRKSIDAMPSVLASLPALGINFVLSHYSGDKLYALPKCLLDNGYKRALFLHGAPNGSMGFDAFAKQAGFNEYYGKTEYGNDADFDGHWGIWDKKFLSKAADVLSERPAPWLATLFTLSSHDPFKVPKEDEGRYPKGELPLQECIGYTDDALRGFFEKAKKETWFNKTIFILMADHASQTAKPVYSTLPGKYAIPMLWYIPGEPLPTTLNKEIIVQQADIYPSLNYLLGISDPIVAFGQNIFDENRPHYALIFDGKYEMIRPDGVCSMDEDGDLDYTEIRNVLLPGLDSLSLHHFKECKLLPAIVQNYNHRLAENRLVEKK